MFGPIFGDEFSDIRLDLPMFSRPVLSTFVSLLFIDDLSSEVERDSRAQNFSSASIFFVLESSCRSMFRVVLNNLKHFDLIGMW